MPRFGIKSLLVAMAIVALWFSTLTGFPGSNEIRTCVLFAIFILSGCAAICYEGRPRAFWGGFFITMLILGSRSFRQFLGPYAPDLSELAIIATRHLVDPSSEEAEVAVYFTIQAALRLGLATALGAMCSYVYSRSRERPTDAR